MTGGELPGVLAQARKADAEAIGGPYPVASVVMRATGFVAVLTAVPARVGARKPVVLTLRSGQP